MLRVKIVGLGAVIATALFMLVGASGVSAQDHKYSTGGVQTPAAKLQSIPAAPVYRDFLPQAVDLSKYFPPVGDQGQQGSCVGWATAYAARAYYAEQVEHRDTKLPQNVPSPAWLFDIIHLGQDCEQGSYIADAMDVLVQGAYSLADFPYDDSKCPAPAAATRTKPTDFRIDSYQQLDLTDLDQVKGQLAKGNPVVVLAAIDDSFFNLSPKHKVWHSDAAQKNDGGHAFTLVGYDDRSKTFKFINSWTTSWGDNGYGRMDYGTFSARVLEGYVMHMAGDPEIVLADADLSPDVVQDTPVFVPPLLLKPSADANRGFDETAAAVDVGTLSCGKVDVTTDANGNSVATGFVGTQAELDRVGEALKGKVDDNQVALAPWPACEVKLTLASQTADSDTPQASVDPVAPKVGDKVTIGVQSPGFASYLYAAYFSADGSVSNLTQPTSADLKPKAGHSVVRFGDADKGQIALVVNKPVGDEMLVVIASEKPLFAAARPDSETDRQFLSGLRQALLTGDSGRVTATILPVTTTD